MLDISHIVNSTLQVVGADDGGRDHVIHFHVAMGTQFAFTGVNCSDENFHDLMKFTDELERKWTRFSSTSELMQVNLNPNTHQPVSPETIRLFQEMQYGHQLTRGLFDPNVLNAMVNLGFAVSSLDTSRTTSALQNTHTDATVMDIEIDIEACTVKIPEGIAVDPGGIGKGLAADLLAERAIFSGADGMAVFAGGEVRVLGKPPTGSGWTIGVEHPVNEGEFIEVLDLIDGGVATSSPFGRISESGGHIVDPRTSQQPDTTAMQVTVVAGDAVDAEVIAKMCLLMPPELAIERVEEIGVDALIYVSDNEQHSTIGWNELCQ